MEMINSQNTNRIESRIAHVSLGKMNFIETNRISVLSEIGLTLVLCLPSAADL